LRNNQDVIDRARAIAKSPGFLGRIIGFYGNGVVLRRNVDVDPAKTFGAEGLFYRFDRYLSDICAVDANGAVRVTDRERCGWINLVRLLEGLLESLIATVEPATRAECDDSDTYIYKERFYVPPERALLIAQSNQRIDIHHARARKPGFARS